MLAYEADQGIAGILHADSSWRALEAIPAEKTKATTAVTVEEIPHCESLLLETSHSVIYLYNSNYLRANPF